MLHEAKNSDLIPQWLGHIEDQQAKEAFVYLVGLAAALTEFQCHAQFKGEVRDFRFITTGEEQPFSFIPNKQWLLFYFRAPSVRSGKYSLQSLQHEFDGAAENTRGEWTVRLRSISDVQRLWKLLAIR
jgi:hypothetical protein